MPRLVQQGTEGMPAAAAQPERPAGISDEAVKAGTGKTWAEWFEILDAGLGMTLGHKGIVALLAEHQRVGPWWRQMVTVAYEQERGLRERHQTPEGFQLSVSRTVEVPADALFRAWTDERARSNWLSHEELTIKKFTSPRTLRIAWGDGSVVDVSISPRGKSRSRVVVDHKRLRDSQDVGLMKEYWAAALDALRQMLEA